MILQHSCRQWYYSVLQWTLYGRYFTAGGQWYCSLNGVCYSEHYVEDTSQQVDSGIAAWMECVTVNIMWKILHGRWTVVLQLECSVLQWTLGEVLDNKYSKYMKNFPSYLMLLLYAVTWIFWTMHTWISFQVLYQRRHFSLSLFSKVDIRSFSQKEA